MGWKTSLPCCWPHDNPRSSMSHCPSHNRPSSEGEGMGHLHVNPLAQQPFRFDCSRGSPIRDATGDGGSDHQPSPHQPPRGWDHNRHWKDQRPPLHHFPLPSPIVGSRVTGVHYQWLPQYQGLIDQMDLGIPKEGDGTERMELIWR